MDLRVQKTYAALTRAFEELLKEKEFDKISINELCEKALIRRPTFYKHFLDKYDFLGFYLREKFNNTFIQAMKTAKKDDPLDLFLTCFDLLLNETEQMEKFIFKIQLDMNLFSELESLHEYGETFISNHVYISGHQKEVQLDMKYQVDLILGVMTQSTLWYLRNKEDVSKKFIRGKFRETLENILQL